MGAFTWNDTPASAVDNAWKTDTGNDSATDGAWAPDLSSNTTDRAFTGEFSQANISRHDAGDIGGAADGGCRICHDDSHFARDCPNKPANSGECYNCGQTGHNKSECTNPRVEREFTGTCRVCDKPGHRAADCPAKPASVCKLCKQGGHIASECSVNRVHSMLTQLGIEELDADAAWQAVVVADQEKEVEDIKKAILTYAKAFPDVTFEELEQTFRDSEFNTYLIAKEQTVSDTHTIINLQGKAEQKYVVSFQFSAKPRRAKFAEGWPSSSEENLVRLSQAGFVMDSLIMKCSNCGELGHGRKSCEQEKSEAAKVIITCAVCNEEGHRARDCTAERKKHGKKGCRNCGSEEHIAKDCDQPPNMDNVECKNCGQTGHFGRDCPSREPETCRNCKQEGHRAKDCTKERVMQCRNCDGLGHVARECPEPKNMAKVQCRNCDEFGHTGRECPKPTDWSRVECSNCKQKGHSYKKCTQPPAEAEAGGDGGWDNGGDSNGAPLSGVGGGWDAGAAASSGSGGWESNNAPAEQTSGGW